MKEDWKTFTLIPAYGYREELRQLYAEYEQTLLEAEPNFGISLAQQNYEEEINELEKKYALPKGRFYLLRQGEKLAGCVGMKPIDRQCAELKRLYIRPAFRGRGLGEFLVCRILDDARDEGYSFLRLDTIPGLWKARKLYQKLGFYEIPAYYDCLIPGTVFLEKETGAEKQSGQPENAG